MNGTTQRFLRPLACMLLLGLAAGAHAQSARACPQLPSDSGLNWDQGGSDAFLICRAVAEDGSEPFGLALSADSAFQPRRGNREERGVVNGQNIRWYRGEDAANPDALVRETLIELDRNQVAHIWIRTDSRQQLDRSMRLVEALRFDDTRVSRN